MTKSGLVCKHWSKEIVKNFPQFDLDNNYCRNLNDHTTIWCYVDTDEMAKGWDECEPKEMTNLEVCSGRNCAGYRG